MQLFRACIGACALIAAISLYGQAPQGADTKQTVSRIRDLGKSDTRSIPALAAYLSDPNADIRVEAVKAIVKIDTEASLTPLVQASHDNDSEIQIRATDGIVNYYVPGYVAKGALTGPLTRGVRQVQGFFGVRNDQEIDPDVVVRPDVQKALADLVSGGATSDSRSNAARAAGILRDRPAVPMLAGSLHAHDSQLIIESLIALQKIGDPSACSYIGSAAHDLDERVETTALETIGDLRCLQCAPDVRSTLMGARNIKVRRAALEALAMLAIPGDRNIFAQFDLNKDPQIRASVMEGLGRIRNPEDFPLLEQTFNEANADWRIHLAAAFGMVNEGKVDTDDLGPLDYLWGSVNSSGRAPVAQAYLDELVRNDAVRKALFSMVSESTKPQKIALCSILAASRAPDSLPTLNTLQKDRDADVSLAASRAIRIMQAQQARG